MALMRQFNADDLRLHAYNTLKPIYDQCRERYYALLPKAERALARAEKIHDAKERERERAEALMMFREAGMWGDMMDMMRPALERNTVEERDYDPA